MYYAIIKKTGEPVEVVREFKGEVQTRCDGFFGKTDLKRISQDEYHRLDDQLFFLEVLES